MGIHGGRRRRWRRRRLHGALRLAWLGGELQSEEAELLRVSERRGGGGGYGNGGRWRRQRSAVRERARGKREWARERAREVRGGAWRRSGDPGDEGRSRRWRACARAASACPCPPGARKGTTGTASWLGRPAGPLGQARLHSDGLHREVSAGGFSSFLSIFVFCNLF